MELRSCNHSHFILAIRHGEVTKALNITGGKPALKSKSIQEICNAQGPEDETSPVASRHKEASRRCCVPSSDVQIKVQRRKEENTAGDDDIETGIAYESIIGDQRCHGNLDDLNFGTMTLKQLMDECKEKKRKISSTVNRTKKRRTRTCPLIKQECVGLEPDDEVLDLDETISSWKLKLSRKCTANKRRRLAFVPYGGNMAACISKGFPGDQDIKASNMDIDMSMSIKLELLEIRDFTPSSGESSTGGNLGLPYDDVGSKMMDTVTADCNYLTLDFASSLKETPCCSPTEDFYVAGKNGNACFSNSQSLSVLEKSKVFEQNQVSYHHLEEEQTLSHSLESSTNKDITTMDELGIMDDQHSPAMTLNQQRDVFISIKSEGSAMNSSTVFNSSDYVGDSIGCSYICGSTMFVDSSVEAGSPSLVDVKLQAKESSHKFEVCKFVDDIGDVLLHDLPQEIITSTLSSHDLSMTSDDVPRIVYEVDPKYFDSPVSRESESSSSDGGNVLTSCFPNGFTCNASNVTPIPTADGSCDHVEQLCSSQRLFSGRKVISPNSQEKLSRLMNSIDLHDETDAQNETIAISATQSTYITSIPGKTRRVKNGKKLLHSKFIVKSPQPSQVMSRFSSGFSSIQDCSQSAIAFSQQQMHDIERLAKKLTNELHTMKEILMETLQSEARTFTLMKCNTNQARVAVENATKVEEMSNKWLSMMTRDCSRFCKIMSLASPTHNIQNESGEHLIKSSPVKTASKERKISFADEAGGTLCHVRFYEAGDKSPVYSQIEVEELQL